MLLQFQSNIAPWYQGTDGITQWPALAPVSAPIPGKIFATEEQYKEYSAEQYFQRGLTHINRYHSAGVPLHKQISPMLITPQILGENYNQITEQEIKNRARSMPLYGLEVHQFAEGKHYLPYDDWRMKIWFRERRAMYEDRKATTGIDYILSVNYGSFGIDHNDGKKKMEALFAADPRQLGNYDINFGEMDDMQNAVTIKAYPRSGDSKSEIYKLRMGFEIIRRAGKKGFAIMWPEYEAMDTTVYGPGYPHETELLGGKFYRSSNALESPGQILTNSFYSYWDGIGIYTWDGKPLLTSEQKVKTLESVGAEHTSAQKDSWVPGPNSPREFTYSDSSDATYPVSPQWPYDFIQMGGHGLYSTCLGTEGGTKKFAPYRINNGPWINPTGDNYTMDAAKQKLGMVDMRYKGRRKTIVVCMPEAGNEKYKIEIAHPENPGNEDLYLEFEGFGSYVQVANF